ncbi:DUF4870 domain-containing protein [Staphylococcus haemolyticus]|nr:MULTISPECIES: DUF4870 domain-containing protein [Staphylococcus]KAA2277368.1 DUF4870 domain-containing protein [Staphylococcus sp. GDX7P312P]KAA2281813.1 DUF4870 domain-containing protein [Staphylococcus sp. GDX7P459A]MBU6949170.1 DUF4870 domain-containing protein [Staphylococcus haemolyticus]MBU7212639.1 DUF4870 domain-containing protein [Staphylococcus haemolyticus]MCE4954355.1 DUF4870 domain-containing protein [Staphylococcus haemolyticus]
MSDYYDQSQDSTVKRDNEDDARLMSMLIFLLGFFTSVIGPIIIWAIKRNESRLVDKAGKNYFNMLISYLIWNFVVGICMVPVFFIYVVNNEAAIIIATILLFVLSLLLIVLTILYVVFHIVACVKYFGGKEYVVPLSIRFFK